MNIEKVVLILLASLSACFSIKAHVNRGGVPNCPGSDTDWCNSNNVNAICRCSNTGNQGCCVLSSGDCTQQHYYCDCSSSGCWSSFLSDLKLYLIGIDNVNSSTTSFVYDNNNNQKASIDARTWTKIGSGQSGVDCTNGCTLKSKNKSIFIAFTKNNGDNASVTMSNTSGNVTTVPYQDGLAGFMGNSSPIIYLNLTITDNAVTATPLTYNVVPFNPSSQYSVSL